MDQPALTIDDLRLYFTNEEWNSLSEYEIKCCLNRLQNYHALLSLGFSASKPYFMEQNESTVKRKNKTAKTTKLPKKFKSVKIETMVRNEEDEENQNVQMIAKRRNENIIRNVVTKVKVRPPLLSVNNNPTETSSAGMTIRENFKKFVKTKVETQVRPEKPTEENQNEERKLTFSEAEKRITIRIHNILNTALKLCKQYKRKGINVLKEWKIVHIRRLLYNKTKGNKDIKREKKNKSNEKKCMKNEGKLIVTQNCHSKNKIKKGNNNKKKANKNIDNKNTEDKRKIIERILPAEPNKVEGEGLTSSCHYSRRNVPDRNYTEEELFDNDEYIFCDDCDREWLGDCPVHGPLMPLADRKVIKNENDNERAIKTTPPQLEVSDSEILGGGKGIWTKCVIPPRVVFGPYDGNISSSPDDLGYSWRITRNGQLSHYVSGKCAGTSNWMRYVNSARYEEERNVFAFQYKGGMYFRTFKHIPPKCELKVWYGKEYNIKLGNTLESFKNPNMKLNKNGVFRCEQCAMAFTSPLYLKPHRNYCYRKRRSIEVISSNLKSGNDKCTESHVKTHTGEKPYSCDVCSYKCTRHDNFKRHMRTHSGEKPHICDVCSYKFTTSGSLKRHMRTHSGEKPYSCDVCSFKCTASDNLKLHMKTHTGEKPYSCNVCSYKCRARNNLKLHMRTHTGEKPYSCDVCSYKCTRHDNLKRHKRTHSEKKPYSCV